MSEFKVEKQGNDSFTMVYNYCLEQLNDVYDISVYVTLCKFADYDDKTAFPSYQTIADRIGCSRNKVIKSMKKLVEIGLVTKKKRRMKTSIYTVIHPVYLDNEVVHEVNSQTSKVHEVNSKGARGELKGVHEVDTNKTHLTKSTYTNTQIEKAKPSSASDRKKFFKSLKGKNQEQIQYLGKIMREFKDKNPTQYPNEFLEYFYKTMISVDEFGITKFEDTFAPKLQFGLGGRLSNWFKNWKPQNSSNNQPQSFREQDRQKADEEWQKVQAFRDSLKYNLIEG